MLQKLEIHGVTPQFDENLRKYVTKKIGGLDKYISRHDRESVHANVFLKEGKAKDKNRFTAEVKFKLPHETVVISESTLNMFAAVDIVEAKLKNQLKKHKDQRQNGKMHRHLFGRFSRKGLLPEQLAQTEV